MNLITPDRDPAKVYHAFGKEVGAFVSEWNAGHPKEQVQVFEGFRSFERQAYLFSLGRTSKSHSPCWHDGKARPVGTCTVHPMGAVVTNAKPGGSLHNYGLAVDIVFDADPVKPGLQASWDGKFPWPQLGAAGVTRGLDWAGQWKSFREFPHFQKTYGLQLVEMMELHRQGGLAAVWRAID